MNYQRRLEGKSSIQREDNEYGTLIVQCKDSPSSILFLSGFIIALGLFFAYATYMMIEEEMEIVFSLLVAVLAIVFIVGGIYILSGINDHLDLYNYGVKIYGRKGVTNQFSYDNIKEIIYEKRHIVSKTNMRTIHNYKVMGKNDELLFLANDETYKGASRAFNKVGELFEIMTTKTAKQDENAVM